MRTPTWQDFYDLGAYTAQVRRPSLVVYPGDASDAMLAGCATMATGLVAYGAGRFKITFLDGASGADLTALCHDRGVDRNEGAQAVGVARFTRPTFTAGAGTIPAGFQVTTETDASGKTITVTTDTDTTFGASDLTKDANCTCTVIDVVGNVDAGTITRMINIASLWDQTLTVTNPTRFARGAPSESDPDLRDRTRNFFLTQARGTIDALIYAAKTVPGVTRVSVIVDDSGIVKVYVADSEGNSNQAMADAVSAVIEGTPTLPAWRDAADIVQVIPGTIYTVSYDVSLTVKLGVDVNTLLTNVRLAIAAQTNRLQPGETLYRDKISAAGIGVDPDAITSCRINSPAVDLTPAEGQSIATDIDHITFS